MNKRVYGIIGISSKMANWNADFSGYPKTTSNGETFGSDKALKYPMKKLWEDQGEKILYVKSMKLVEGKNKEVSLNPRSLKERYENLFDVKDLSKENDNREILKNLFSCLDVKNFGATFAESKKNISITGAVQIGQGFNKYEDTNPEEQQILSPFRADKKSGKDDNVDSEEAKNSTLGTKIVSDEAHYFYPFVINPNSYKEFVEMGVTDGYTFEDYKRFKEASLVSATYFNTNAKVGCENEFALFVETDENLYLPNLSEYVEFKKGEKNVIKLNCSDLLNSVKEKIKNIEVYYNTYTTEIECSIDNVKFFDIFTQREVDGI